jgi:predicted phosphate transport protein (TIGR00153 family)
MRFALVPRQSEFYALFAAAGENTLAAARVVERRFRDPASVSQDELKELEHEGDRITGELIGLLNTQYVTPLDREDIYALASAVDDAVDYMDDAGELLELYRIDHVPALAVKQCEVLVKAAESLAAALGELRAFQKAQPRLIEIKRLEDEGDSIVREAIGALFADETINPRSIIQWKDIHEGLEEAIDSCETAAHVIGNIVVKNG